MMLLIFLLLALQPLVIWLFKREIGLSVFGLTLILATILFIQHVTETLNLNL